MELSLPQRIEDYEPRACDCDFCQARDAAYLSDPQGRLVIYQSDQLEKLTQGSEQASFWQCSSCQELVAVTCDFGEQIKGAINAGALKRSFDLKPAVSVSPKTLAPEEKFRRWSTVWLTVEFRG